MPSCTTRRLIPFVLAAALVLIPASFATASPVLFDAPAIQTADQGGFGFFSWVANWFQDLVSVSDSAAGQSSGVTVGPPQPSDGLTDTTEEEDRSPTITVDG